MGGAVSARKKYKSMGDGKKKSDSIYRNGTNEVTENINFISRALKESTFHPLVITLYIHP